MADTPHSCILLRYISSSYPRGTLLEMNKDGSYEKHTHIKRNYITKPIRFDNDGDVAPLSELECDLLYGTVSVADRYDAYSTPGKMEWGRSLEVGKSVLAQLSEHSADQYTTASLSRSVPPRHYTTTAIIRWCGRIDNGYWFGVEITVSSYVCIPSCIEIP